MTRIVALETPARVLVMLAAIVGAAVLLISPLRAQSFYGSIVGRVTDASSAIVPDATVTLTDVATNETRTAQTNGSGDYSFVSLVPATYRVEVQKAGFKRYVRDQAIVEVNTTVRVDAALEVGAVSETVEVSTQTPLLQTDSGTLGSVIEGQTIEAMPLNGRNTMNLLELAPGVVPANGSQGAVALGTGTHTNTSNWTDYSVGGGLNGQSAMFVDGAPLNELAGGLTQGTGSVSGAVGYVPTQDSVQEFNISTNSTSAEFGRYSGGVVNMTTRSGTNRWHGSAYEFLRNNVLNSNEFFNKQTELAAGEPNTRTQYNQNQYGAIFDGPIKKNKVFFMFNWEAFAARTASLAVANVPTLDQQAGYIDGLNLLTAQTGLTTLSSVCPAATSATSGTTPNGYSGTYTYIPPSCWNATAVVMKTEWPDPARAQGSNNYSATSGTGSNTANYTGRVDYTISEKQRFFGRYTASNLHDLASQAVPGGVCPASVCGTAFTWNIGGGATITRSQDAVLGDTYTFNPTTILDVRLSYLRDYAAQNTPTDGMNLGVFGSNWAAMAKTESVVNIPTLSFGSDVAISGFRGSNQISYQWNDTEALSVSLTKILGPHSLKVGLDERYMDLAVLNASGANNTGGQYNFGTQNYTSSSWANFLLGTMDSMSVATAREVGSYNWYGGYYVNDNWQAARKLTIMAGLRWDLLGNIKEKRDRAMELEPTLTDAATGVYGTVVLVNSPSYPDRGTEPARHDLFSPRLGFAYRLTDNDVIRGGYAFNVMPPDIQSGMFPSNLSMNSFTNTWTYPSVTYGTGGSLSNPWPANAQNGNAANVLNQPLGRTGFSVVPFLTSNLSAPVPTKKFPYTEQWNLSVSHQFKGNLMVEIAYAGTVGTHQPMGQSYNELAPAYWADQTMPLVNTAACGSTTSYVVWAAGRTTNAQCHRPHPAFQTFSDVIGNIGSNNYNSMPVRVEKRFRSGGVLTASYTWAKSMGNLGGGSVQDWYNLPAEYSLTSFSIPNRAVFSYVLNLPFGKGGKYLANVNNGVVQHLITGWALNGITTFQTGFPLSLAASEPTSYQWTDGNRYSVTNIPASYGAGLRPNYTAGCVQKASGSLLSHVLAGSSVFNPCWAAPPPVYLATVNGKTNLYATTLGNETRVDGATRQPGIENWDIAARKSTQLTEKVNLEFRMEFFNLFNRVQFGAPATTVGATAGTLFGVINASSQNEGQQRLGQASLRVSF